MIDIALIGCCKPKLATPAPARALYLSNLFKLSLELALRRHAVVYVVSAEYELVELDRVIAPYDKTMGDIAKEWKSIWGARVWSSIIERHPGLGRHRGLDESRRITFYCGKEYADPIRAAGHRAPAVDTFVYPLDRMQIGQRLSWLKQELAR